MKDLTELITQLLGHPLTAVVCIVLLIIGGPLIAVGAMGYVPIFKKDLSETRARVCVVSGAGLLAVGLFVGLLSWAWAQSWPKGLILGEYVGAMAIVLVAIIAFYGAALLRSRLNELLAEEKRLVHNVEDATRHVLKGFPLIFDRALRLVEEADREICLVNFALNFGGPHCSSTKGTRLFTEIADVYNRLPMGEDYPYKNLRSRDFVRDVGKLLATLTDKVALLPVVHILTVTDEGAKPNFITPLSKRPRYIDCYTQEKINSVYGELISAKNEILKRMQTGRNLDKWEGEGVQHEAIFCETGSMPIQMLIAGQKSAGTGCLVFMVGTEILQGLAEIDAATDASSAVSPKEFGFYTELEEVVMVYKGLAYALIKQAEKEQAKQGKTPRYKEDLATAA